MSDKTVFVELTLEVTDPAALKAFAESAGFDPEDTGRGAAWCAAVLIQSIIGGSVPGLECPSIGAGYTPGELVHRSGTIHPDALTGGEAVEEPF